MIQITTFRPTFRHLRVGDQFLVNVGNFHHHWEARTVTRVTENDFIYGYGEVKPSGLHKYQERYNRDTGALRGAYKSATLPTPELVAEINAELEARANLHFVQDAKFSDMEPAQIAQLAALIKSFNPPSK